MKTDFDVDDFLRAERAMPPDLDAHKEEARERLEMILGPLAAVGSIPAPPASPAVASNPANSAGSVIAKTAARTKLILLTAGLLGGFAIGMSTHAALDQRKAHSESDRQPLQITLPSVVAPTSPASEIPAPSNVPERDIETLPVAASARAPSASAGASSSTKSDLASESVLLETARTALERNEPEHAMAALDRHRQKFPNGQLSEERESLTIYALVAEGKMDEARAKTIAFHATYRNSLQGPALDALTKTP